MDDELQRQQVTRLALQHRSELWAYLMGLAKDPHRAEDLFQNTHLVICQKWRQYRPGTNFLAWARQIARYEFLASVDPARHSLVTVEADLLESALAAASPVPVTQREALRTCLEKLPSRGRRVIELRYGEAVRGQEAARRLALSVNAFYTYLSRLRQMLHDCVKRQLSVSEP
jgi:RNA polymerase sigma-70 factor (ECF subfamily)